MKVQNKPQNIGTFADGNAIWDNYKIQNEMLQKYEEKMIRGKETNNQFTIDRCEKRIPQYKKQVEDAETQLIQFCQKHNITIQ